MVNFVHPASLTDRIAATLDEDNLLAYLRAAFRVPPAARVRPIHMPPPSNVSSRVLVRTSLRGGVILCICTLPNLIMHVSAAPEGVENIAYACLVGLIARPATPSIEAARLINVYGAHFFI